MRFKVELSDDAAFATSSVIADHTAEDVANPGAKAVEITGKRLHARYVRVTATKLWQRGKDYYCFALRQLVVTAGDRNAAADAKVTYLDSVQDYGWGYEGLTDNVLVNAVEPKHTGPQSLLLRREFAVPSQIKRAVVHVSGLGQYEMTINGSKVGNDLLTPGWTDYRNTILYNTYDVTAQIKQGGNAIGLLLGNGMYSVEKHKGRYIKFEGWLGSKKVIAQLEIEYTDGKRDIIATDEKWTTHDGPITFSNVYGGEDFDARLVQKGWDRADFSGEQWANAVPAKSPGGKLQGISVANPPIRTFETFKPISSTQIKPGVTVYDMGQNASVMPRITVKGPAGSSVKITPGENLHADGTVNQHSGGGPSYWLYTLSGNGSESYFSKFFYRGSRYQQVELIPAKGTSELPVVEQIESVMVHADVPVIGTFETSNDLFNRIWALVRWAQRSNTFSVLTDCPHREKLGWLEEDHLNGPSLRYNFDMSGLFAKAMNDMADAQQPNGFVPNIAPEYVKFGGNNDLNPFRNSPEWGSAFILVAWQQYLFNGDVALLRKHYDAMTRYVAYLDTKAKDHILDFGLGDWYDIGPKPPGKSQLTPIALTATAIYYEDVTVLAKTAKMLGKEDDEKKYTQQAREIRQAFNAKFFDEKTRTYASNSQTSNAMPLVLDIVAPEHRQAVVDAIVKDIRDRGNALTAGDVGYRYLLRALADNGRSDVIYDMNNQSERPGYGMQLARGATSLAEAWDANPASSLNHFMLGQINEWFFHDLAGIQPDPTSPGFNKFIIKPAIVGDLKWVKCTYNSVRGMIAVDWKHDETGVTINVTVPPNTSAIVYVPAGKSKVTTINGKVAAQVLSAKAIGSIDNCSVFEVGSGSYTFQQNRAK